MCGIFGIISKNKIDKKDLNLLVKYSQQRGKDSSGLIYMDNDRYNISRADHNIDKLLKKYLEFVESLYYNSFQFDVSPHTLSRSLQLKNSLKVDPDLDLSYLPYIDLINRLYIEYYD